MMKLSDIYDKSSSVGSVFRRLRRGVGAYQKQIESRLGVGKSWVSYREKTERYLKIIDAILISAALGIHPLTMFVELLMHFGRFDELPSEVSVALYKFYCDDMMRAAKREIEYKLLGFDKDVTDEDKP